MNLDITNRQVGAGKKHLVEIDTGFIIDVHDVVSVNTVEKNDIFWKFPFTFKKKSIWHVYIKLSSGTVWDCARFSNKEAQQLIKNIITAGGK